MKGVKAVIMAGGFGTRIQPLTHSIPKPMLPICGIPMMERIIVYLRGIDIRDVVVLLYFKPDVVRDYFHDGAPWGVNITYVLPDNDYGTAGAVGFAREYLDTTFMVVSGDLVTDFKLGEMINFHRERKAKLTIGLTSVEDPLQFGVIIAGSDGKIERFLEKPSWGEVFSDTINTGIYVIEPEILECIPDRETCDFSKDLFPELLREGVDIWGWEGKGYWRDVGNPVSYREVHRDAFRGKIGLCMPGDKLDIDGAEVFVGRHVRIPSSVELSGKVILGNNVVLGKDCVIENCVIEDDSVIGSGVVLKDCVIWQRVNVGNECNFENAVICNDCVVGEKSEAQQGVVVAEGCHLGSFVTIASDVAIWPYKIIDNSAVVTQNIVWGDRYRNVLFKRGEIVGTANIELTPQMVTRIAESFGSILSEGSTVYVSRDYHKSSRMIKRSLLAGLLSTGVNVVDIKSVPSTVMRHELFKREDAVAGIHVRQSVSSREKTDIIFFTSEGLVIDTNIAKSVERVFFREQFRRSQPNRIGSILKPHDMKEKYKQDIVDLIDLDVFADGSLKVAVDLMHGLTSDIYPEILNLLKIDNVILDDYESERKLSSIPENFRRKELRFAKIVKCLGADAGIIIYPNGQRLKFVDDNGNLVDEISFLLSTLILLNLSGGEYKVLMPVWGPDVMDGMLENLSIERGKMMGQTAGYLKQFDLIVDTDSHLAFVEFGLHFDAMFASLKILELLIKVGLHLSEVVERVPDFYYRSIQMYCPSSFKGRMMRRFMKDAGKGSVSHKDGIKAVLGEMEWVLMRPDDYDETVHLYIQSPSRERGKEIESEFTNKISKWVEAG